VIIRRKKEEPVIPTPAVSLAGSRNLGVGYKMRVKRKIKRKINPNQHIPSNRLVQNA